MTTVQTIEDLLDAEWMVVMLRQEAASGGSTPPPRPTGAGVAADLAAADGEGAKVD